MLIHAVLLFVAQFTMVSLLALQSRFVRDSQYAFAFANSLLLGVCGIYITPILADGDHLRNSPALLLAYLFAGPVAVCAAIWIHNTHLPSRKESDGCNCNHSQLKRSRSSTRGRSE